jgi:folate-binding Fe-S cluster repair protein YgfZ
MADRSDFARIESTGRDILDLLHRLSTQDLKNLAPGMGRPTVLTSPKGRIVERLFVFRVAPLRVLLVGSRLEGAAARIVEHLRRFTFSEDAGLQDATLATRAIVLCGPTSNSRPRRSFPFPSRSVRWTP